MLKKILVGICLTTFCITGFAGIEETREKLKSFCGGNPEVVRGFDRVAASWEAYAVEYENEWDLSKLLTAVEFAAEKHAGQTRKDAEKTPYIIHPIGVSELLWNEGYIRSINVLSAALLHDTLEDTDATEAELKELFGERILMTVKEVTNDPALTGEENKQRQIQHAPRMSLDGQLVKLADRLYNIRDLEVPPPEWSKEKVDAYYGWGEKLLSVLRGTNEGLELALYNIRDLEVPPPEWSKEKVDAYYGWGEKLLSVLRGTNEGLELALQERIEAHKGHAVSPCIRRHIVIQSNSICPYEEERIHEYHFTLDDESHWTFPSSIYDKYNLSLQAGDGVEITFLGGGLYLMNILSDEILQKGRFIFEKATCGVKAFYALEDQ